MFCPNCGAEYRSGIERCQSCDVPLVDDPPGEEGNPDGELDLITVFETDNLAVLSMAESLLEESGIEFLTQGSRLQDSGFPVNEPAWIQVDKADLEAAKEALTALEQGAVAEEDDSDDQEPVF